MGASLLALAKSIYYFMDVTNRYWLHEIFACHICGQGFKKKQERIIVAGPNQVVYTY